MMPIKSGYQLTQELKKDPRTSHIPIIILTAKTKQEDKLEGLQSGVDVFLAKPFNKEELFIRIEKLIALKLELQRKYETGIESTNLLDLTIEDIFMNNVIEVVKNNIENSEFDDKDLALNMKMSSSQLYRKMKALTGRTPNHFIRKHRLTKAIEYLSNSDLNISEICYKIGFNDPNYFSRIFSQEFGKSPSSYRK